MHLWATMDIFFPVDYYQLIFLQSYSKFIQILLTVGEISFSDSVLLCLEFIEYANLLGMLLDSHPKLFPLLPFCSTAIITIIVRAGHMFG